MKIIDVTLRDGGHLMKFDWDLGFAKEYYNTVSSLEEVDIIELGYWKQSSKSTNYFYNLDMEKVLGVTGGAGKKNTSIMIDYHYCLKDLEEYPTAEEQDEIYMIRVCSRKDDIDDALEFSQKLKSKTGLNVSFNVFNSSNYTKEELDEISEKIANSNLDYVYFADTHGAMDLDKEIYKFEGIVDVVKSKGKKLGFHLHDHGGKAYYNFRNLPGYGFEFSDTSVRGMGKGSGNLRLEYILEGENLVRLSKFINKYPFLKTNPNAYELITSLNSVSDNYAKQALELNLDIERFNEICSNLSGLDRDNFDENIIKNNL